MVIVEIVAAVATVAVMDVVSAYNLTLKAELRLLVVACLQWHTGHRPHLKQITIFYFFVIILIDICILNKTLLLVVLHSILGSNIGKQQLVVGKGPAKRESIEKECRYPQICPVNELGVHILEVSKIHRQRWLIVHYSFIVNVPFARSYINEHLFIILHVRRIQIEIEVRYLYEDEYDDHAHKTASTV